MDRQNQSVYKLIASYVGEETRLSCLECLVPAGIVAVVVYAVTTIIFKGATEEEIELLPMGRTLASFLKRKKWL